MKYYLRRMAKSSPRLLVAALLLSLALGLSLQSDAMPQESAVFLHAAPSAPQGATCSEADPCTIAGAQTAAHLAMDGTRDIAVQLRGGTYELSETLTFGPEDSGENGRTVSYEAYSGEAPVLSGGRALSGNWTLWDGNKNIYRLPVPPDADSRQLYVDGERATRARSANNPTGFTRTSTGYTTTDPYMQNWYQASELEFVDGAQWKQYRCGVKSISGSAVTMDQPCWANSQQPTNEQWKMGLPNWIENSRYLIDQPGEWYLDEVNDALFYKPPTGTNPNASEFVLPKLEKLVEGNGVSNLILKGLTFSHATWNEPSESAGYNPGQAGFNFYDTARQHRKPLANVNFYDAHSVRLERNSFKDLGGVAVGIETGQNNAVIGNKITDVSGGGIYIGGVHNSHPDSEAERVVNSRVENNYVSEVGVEYQDQVGIWLGYSEGTTVSHNDLSYLPYTAISSGWGWGAYDPGGQLGYTTPTQTKDVLIKHNLIHDYMRVSKDGGALYALGAHPGSYMTDNRILNQHQGSGAIFPDQGATGLTFERNVMVAIPYWLHIWTPQITGNTIRYNYSDTASKTLVGTGNVTDPNTVCTNRRWNTEANIIISRAGLESSYRDLRGNAPMPVPRTPATYTQPC